ncbi:hypothetical protein LDO26_01090 [Luteimonas sp. BDR2-5]|uniref:hypothetical protein n=1 Tax=Proluteimonas luteida TaxID=2878685 RepID=UPI001E3E60D7|nr:hypothetical protein [Luteimonas sp. BDR2-5]MCD9026811.1 hypothetical protein [Luteimonas sp. BDR2-5]
MTTDHPRSRPSSGSNAEERKAWASFYARVSKESTLAAEVVAQLDRDPELKRAHLALFLCCRESLRTHKVREERNRRIAQAVRWLFRLVFVVPLRLLAGGMARGTDIALASLLLEAKQEPAVRHVKPPVRKKSSATDKATPDRQSAQDTG